MTLPADKPALRAAMRERRRGLALANPEAARQAAAGLPIGDLPPFAVVGGYRPMGAEFDPRPVLAALAAAGAVIAFPAAPLADAPLTFHADDDPRPMIPDLLIAPLLAFDAQGGRLGQGGGHFDRTMAALRAAGPLFVIGLAFAGQEVEAVPLEAHDQRLDAILTEIGYRRIAKD